MSKQCSTCQLSNCWALLQPLCLAREGRMRGRVDEKKKKNRGWGSNTARGQIRKAKIRERGKGSEGKKKARDGVERGGMERAGSVHTYTPSSWSQKSAAGEGAGRPQGGGGWAGLGWAGRGCAGLGWAGLGQRVQSRAYSLQAMGSEPSLWVPGPALWSPLLTQGQRSPLSNPQSLVRHILEEVDSGKTKVNAPVSRYCKHENDG